MKTNPREEARIVYAESERAAILLVINEQPEVPDLWEGATVEVDGRPFHLLDVHLTAKIRRAK